MCIGNFAYVLVGEEENKRIILCKQKDYSPWAVQKVARKVFPELFPKIFSWLFSTPIKKWTCQKMVSSYFDCQIHPWKRDNDWNKNQFVAMDIFEVGAGERVCRARVIKI